MSFFVHLLFTLLFAAGCFFFVKALFFGWMSFEYGKMLYQRDYGDFNDRIDDRGHGMRTLPSPE